MKKEYKRLEIHVKESTIQEKAEAMCEENISYFDKKDVLSISKQSRTVYNRKIWDEAIDKYLEGKDIDLYTVRFILGDTLKNIILSNEQLKYLCED